MDYTKAQIGLENGRDPFLFLFPNNESHTVRNLYADLLKDCVHSKRDSRWSESIAVGSVQFAELMKTTVGATARGQTIRGAEDGFELRETQSGYNAVFDPENDDIGPNKP